MHGYFITGSTKFRADICSFLHNTDELLMVDQWDHTTIENTTVYMFYGYDIKEGPDNEKAIENQITETYLIGDVSELKTYKINTFRMFLKMRDGIFAWNAWIKET